MSLKQATLSGAFIGRSAKTVRMPWVAQMQTTSVADASGTGFTAGGTANTKGAWNQLISSTTADVSLLVLNMGNGTNGSTDQGTLIDIGIGSVGAETAIVSNLAIGGWFSSNPNWSFPITVFIPSGSRIAYRGQCGVASRSFLLNTLLFGTNDTQLLPRSVDVIGSSAGNSRGTAMSGASGTWVELAPATSQPYQGFVLVPSMGGTTGLGNVTVRLTLGFGAAGSETEIGSVSFNSGGIALVPRLNNEPSFVIGRPLPAGQRLVVRHNIASNPDRVQACVIGVPFR